MSEQNKESPKKDTSFSIAKVFLYMVGFSIIMRCDLWLSLYILGGIVVYYLLHNGFFIKIKNYATVIQHVLSQTTDFTKVYPVHNLEKQKMYKEPFSVHNIDSAVIPNSPNDAFQKKRFEEIWKDYS